MRIIDPRTPERVILRSTRVTSSMRRSWQGGSVNWIPTMMLCAIAARELLHNQYVDFHDTEPPEGKCAPGIGTWRMRCPLFLSGKLGSKFKAVSHADNSVRPIHQAPLQRQNASTEMGWDPCARLPTDLQNILLPCFESKNQMYYCACCRFSPNDWWGTARQ